MNTIAKNTLVFLSCCFLSFLNYCVFTTGIILHVPLTILLIALFFAVDQKIPGSFIIILGIFDDVMMNANIGMFPSIYLIAAYTLSEITSRTTKSAYVIGVSIWLYILINVALNQ
jgi:hypothetical protein